MNIGARIIRLERTASARADGWADRELVARLSPVERQQRLLAIREQLANDPVKRAIVDAALQETRNYRQ